MKSLIRYAIGELTLNDNTLILSAEQLNKPGHSERGLSEPMITQSGLKRLDYIDGLRAISALWVVLHHAWLMQQPSLSPEHHVLLTLLGVLAFGKVAVMVFLVLSGFCLYYPLSLKNPHKTRMSLTYSEFMARRVRRILPPYFAALAASLLFILAIPAMHTIPSNAPSYLNWRYALPINWKAVVSHILLVHNLVGYSLRIDPPMWSIGLEWQLYLLFPLLVVSLRKYNTFMVVCGVLIITLICRLLGERGHGVVGSMILNGPWSYGIIFLAGMLAARLVASGSNLIPRSLLWIASLSAFALPVLLRAVDGTIHDLSSCLGAFCLILLASDRNSKLHRWLSVQALVRVGIFSYSIYLVHTPLEYLGWLICTHCGLNSTWTFVALVAIVVPLVVLISYGFHVLFERPYMGKGKAVPRLVFASEHTAPLP